MRLLHVIVGLERRFVGRVGRKLGRWRGIVERAGVRALRGSAVRGERDDHDQLLDPGDRGQVTLSFAGVSLVGGQAVATFSGPRGIVTYNCTAGTWPGGIEHEADGVFVLVTSFANETDLPSGFEIDQTRPNLTGENGLTGGQVEFGALSIVGVALPRLAANHRRRT